MSDRLIEAECSHISTANIHRNHNVPLTNYYNLGSLNKHLIFSIRYEESPSTASWKRVFVFLIQLWTNPSTRLSINAKDTFHII